MEDTRAISGWYGVQEILGLPSMSAEQTIALTDAVTIEDVHRVANKLMSNESIQFAVVGPLDGEQLLSDIRLNI
jgi:predicted Zn-dependent peptidase